MAHWVIGSSGRQGEKQLWMSEEELEGRLQVAAGREADWQEGEISYA